jgi:hypothetical protein
MSPFGELTVIGNRARLVIQPEVGFDYRRRRNVILTAGDQEQGCTFAILKINCGGGMRIEVGECSLEQDVIGPGTAYRS